MDTSTPRPSPARWIIAGGLLVGTLDLLFASGFWAMRNVPPIRIAQSIAAGVLGDASFDGGAASAWLPGLRATDEGVPPPELSPPPRDPVLLTALLADDPPALLRRLRSSNAEVARAAAMTKGPADPGRAGEVAVRSWLAAVCGRCDWRPRSCHA